MINFFLFNNFLLSILKNWISPYPHKWIFVSLNYISKLVNKLWFFIVIEMENPNFQTWMNTTFQFMCWINLFQVIQTCLQFILVHVIGKMGQVLYFTWIFYQHLQLNANVLFYNFKCHQINYCKIILVYYLINQRISVIIS